MYLVPKQRDIHEGWGVEERTTPAQRPAPSSLHPYTMAGEAKMELTEPKEPKEPYAKWLEQPGKGGVEY